MLRGINIEKVQTTRKACPMVKGQLKEFLAGFDTQQSSYAKGGIAKHKDGFTQSYNEIVMRLKTSFKVPKLSHCFLSIDFYYIESRIPMKHLKKLRKNACKVCSIVTQQELRTLKIN